MRIGRKARHLINGALAGLTVLCLGVSTAFVYAAEPETVPDDTTEQTPAQNPQNDTDTKDQNQNQDPAGSDNDTGQTQEKPEEDNSSSPGQDQEDPVEQKLVVLKEILQFEGEVPAANLTGTLGQTPDLSTLPEKARALLKIGNADLSYQELNPLDYGELPQGYERFDNQHPRAPSIADAVYQVKSGSQDVYRIFGTVYDKTGWFGYDPDTASITGMIEETNLYWDPSQIDLNQEGLQTLDSAVPGFVSDVQTPYAEILLEKPEETETPDKAKDESGAQKTDGKKSEDEDKSSQDEKSDDKTGEDGTDKNENGKTDDDSDKSDDSPEERSVVPMRIALHTLQWIDGSSNSEVSPNSLSITPDANTANGSSVTAQLNFSLGGDQTIPAGLVKIVIPYHIFYNREGKPVGTISLPLVEAPQEAGLTGFNYSIDKEKDEIIITNYKPVPSSYNLTCQIAWSFTPSEIKDGYTKKDIQAKFTVTNAEGTKSLSDTSEPISVDVHTEIPEPVAQKSIAKKQNYWSSEWGEKPAGADDDVYVIYTLHTLVNSSTQPWSLHLKEQPGEGGRLIGWYDPSNTGTGTFHAGNETDFESLEPISVAPTDTTGAVHENVINVVVAYNKEQAAKDGVLKNTYSAIVRGLDSGEKKADSSTECTYTPDGQYYPADGVSIGKSGSSSLNGAISALNGGGTFQSPSDFTISIESRGYDMTENGTKAYTTNLDDDQMYLQGEKLLSGDYAFNSFTPLYYDEYKYDYSAENGFSENRIPDSEYAPIEVYTNTGGGWQKYGELTISGSTFTFNGSGVSQSGLLDSNSVSLPSGVIGVSFRQTGKQAYVKYGMGLGYSLIGSSHVQNILANQTQADLYNVDSGFTKNEEGNITSGASIPSVPEGISQQIENSDLSKYGQVVEHADALDTMFSLQGTSQSYKLAEAPVSDPVNARETVEYTLVQFDSAFSFVPGQLQEAVKSGAVNKHTNGIFYDLLPAGTSVDLSSIQAMTYNPTGQGEECKHYEQIIPNWRGSGQDMLMINVLAPDQNGNYTWLQDFEVMSGLQVKFKLIDTWTNIRDTSTTINNTFAYYSNNGPLATGDNNDGGYLPNKEYYKDLTGYGRSDPYKNNTQYGEVSTTFGITKLCRL